MKKSKISILTIIFIILLTCISYAENIVENQISNNLTEEVVDELAEEKDLVNKIRENEFYIEYMKDCSDKGAKGVYIVENSDYPIVFEVSVENRDTNNIELMNVEYKLENNILENKVTSNDIGEGIELFAFVLATKGVEDPEGMFISMVLSGILGENKPTLQKNGWEVEMMDNADDAIIRMDISRDEYIIENENVSIEGELQPDMNNIVLGEGVTLGNTQTEMPKTGIAYETVYFLIAVIVACLVIGYKVYKVER